MSGNRKDASGTIVAIVVIVLILAGGGLGIAALAAGATTAVSRSQSKAQVAQAQAVQAEQAARQAEHNARQEAERRKTTEVMMEPSIMQAQTLYTLAIAGSERDDRILDAYLKLTMEGYNTREHWRLVLEILVFGMPIALAVGTAFYWFNRDQ